MSRTPWRKCKKQVSFDDFQRPWAFGLMTSRITKCFKYFCSVELTNKQNHAMPSEIVYFYNRKRVTRNRLIIHIRVNCNILDIKIMRKKWNKNFLNHVINIISWKGHSWPTIRNGRVPLRDGGRVSSDRSVCVCYLEMKKEK